jgi:hypothetical protein
MKHANLLHAIAGLVLAGALTACAGQGADGAGAGSGGTATTITTITIAPTTIPAPVTPTTAKLAPGGQLTATGTIREGVEPGCLLLDADQGGNYLLVGGDRDGLRTGARVQVTGRLARDLLSTCQQGEPLVVASIAPAR